MTMAVASLIMIHIDKTLGEDQHNLLPNLRENCYSWPDGGITFPYPFQARCYRRHLDDANSM